MSASYVVVEIATGRAVLETYSEHPTGEEQNDD